MRTLVLPGETSVGLLFHRVLLQVSEKLHDASAEEAFQATARNFMGTRMIGAMYEA